MSRITTGASNLGKIAKEYGMTVRTLSALIAAYPDLKKEISLHTKGYVNKGRKTLPPGTVDKIFAVLGDP